MGRRGFLLLALCLGLSACGFQLRGLVAVPEALQRLNLQGNNSSPAYLALERQLRANGIELVDDPRQTAYQIRLYGEQINRRAATLNTRGKTEEYELRSELSFEIFDRDNQSVTNGPVTVDAERTYRYDENNVNAMQAEERLLRDELRNTVASQVIRRYLALAGDSQPASR